MKKHLKCALGLALVMILTAACGEENSPPTPKGSLDIEGYRSWPLRRQAVTSPQGHGPGHVYANDIVGNYLAKVAPEGVTGPAILRYPVGSIIVKDVFRADGTLKYVVILRKPEEIPPEATAYGGWVWAQRNTSTEVDRFKTAEDCLDCHTGANSEKYKDYVYVFPKCEGSVSCVQ